MHSEQAATGIRIAGSASRSASSSTPSSTLNEIKPPVKINRRPSSPPPAPSSRSNGDTHPAIDADEDEEGAIPESIPRPATPPRETPSAAPRGSSSRTLSDRTERRHGASVEVGDENDGFRSPRRDRLQPYYTNGHPENNEDRRRDRDHNWDYDSRLEWGRSDPRGDHGWNRRSDHETRRPRSPGLPSSSSRSPQHPSSSARTDYDDHLRSSRQRWDRQRPAYQPVSPPSQGGSVPNVTGPPPSSDAYYPRSPSPLGGSLSQHPQNARGPEDRYSTSQWQRRPDRYSRDQRDRRDYGDGWYSWKDRENTDDRDSRRRGPSPVPPRQDSSRPDREFRKWSPTPPHHHRPASRGDTTSVDRDGVATTTTDNGRMRPPYDSDLRPPSRMGREDPAPPLSRFDGPRASTSSSSRFGMGSATVSEVPRKRSHSPPGSQSSPPAGLLKRKSNFSAVVVPEVVQSASTTPADGTQKKLLEESDPIPPGPTAAPPHPSLPVATASRINTLESPVLPSNPGSRAATDLVNGAGSSQPGSNLPSTQRAHPSAAIDNTASNSGPQISQIAAACGALDDPDSPCVRLSCTPRKPSTSAAITGRERRKTRPPPVPLDKRKFHGCSSLDDYEISIKLGQGTFGEVLKGRHILTGQQVALKKVTIHDAKDGLPITALREIKLLKKLKHPSIVPVVDMAYRPSGERGKLGDVYMVEPYMDHDLNGMLENPNIRLEHSQIKLYMKQLLEGTLYLHKNRILHRDMKAANLLINNQGQLQIADFGLARPYRDPGQSWTANGWKGGLNKYTNMVVTRWYRPPELLAGEKKYGPPIDLWGIGCILAEMVTGKPLFKGTSEINQLELISRLCGSPNDTTFPGWTSLPGVKDADPTGRPDPHPEVPGRHFFGTYQRSVKDFFRTVVDVGPECADLIDKLLVLDPTKRLTASQALNHDWFWTKPYPADPRTLPKYEHSKEIDRVKREWKPAHAGSNSEAQQQQQQQQRLQPQGGVLPPAAQMGMGMGMGGIPTMGAAGGPPPPLVPSMPFNNSAAAVAGWDAPPKAAPKGWTTNPNGPHHHGNGAIVDAGGGGGGRFAPPPGLVRPQQPPLTHNGTTGGGSGGFQRPTPPPGPYNVGSGAGAVGMGGTAPAAPGGGGGGGGAGARPFPPPNAAYPPRMPGGSGGGGGGVGPHYHRDRDRDRDRDRPYPQHQHQHQQQHRHFPHPHPHSQQQQQHQPSRFDSTGAVAAAGGAKGIPPRPTLPQHSLPLPLPPRPPLPPPPPSSSSYNSSSSSSFSSSAADNPYS